MGGGSRTSSRNSPTYAAASAVRFTDAVADELRRAAKAGLVRDDLDAEITARALTAMVDRFCFVTYVFDPPDAGPPDASVAAKELATLWADAIGLGATPRQ